jgi:hypothetical protein
MNKEFEYIEVPGGVILPGCKSLVTFKAEAPGKEFFSPTKATPIEVGVGRKTYEVVPWGRKNNLPQMVSEKMYASEVVSSNIEFNVETGYGQGITPVIYEYDAQGKRIPKPFYGNAEINAWLEENNISNYMLEQLTDMKMFFNVFPEIILSNDGKKITNIYSKEAMFSRWEKRDKEGVIRHHFYSADWGNTSVSFSDVADNEPVVTPVLDSRFPLRDLRERILKGNDRRFIVPVSFPTPGRMYYQKPYWWSIFESGWYDYATLIPQYKRKIIAELSVIRYHVELSEDYFEQIYKAEKLTEDKDREARRKKEYENINAFLSDGSNTNKSVISSIKYSPDGAATMQRMKITKIDDSTKGGEFIEDSEEASNILCYAMGVHPSIRGASPGKSKTINGTEARELFIVKQNLERTYRDILLFPFNHIIKPFNGWPEDVFFHIFDITLTTLDKSNNGTATLKTEI